MLSSLKKVGVAFLGHRPLKSRLRADSSLYAIRPAPQGYLSQRGRPGQGSWLRPPEEAGGSLLGDCAAGA